MSKNKYTAVLDEELCKIKLFNMGMPKGTFTLHDDFQIQNGSIHFTGQHKKCVPLRCFLGDIDALYQALCECKIAQQSDVTIEAGDISIDNTGVVESLESLCAKIETDATTQSEILACLQALKNQETTKQQFINPTPCVMYEVSDVKGENPVNLIEYFDCVNNKFVQFEIGVEPIEENIFNSENYIKMSRLFGSRDISPIQQFKSKSNRVTVAMTGAPVDIVTTIQAQIDASIAGLMAKGVVLPDGASLKVSCITATQHPDKKMVFDDVAQADAQVTSGGQVKHVFTDADTNVHTDFITVGDNEASFGNQLIDNGECIGKALDGCEVKAGDLTAEGPAGSFVEYCYDLACYAPAPTEE